MLGTFSRSIGLLVLGGVAMALTACGPSKEQSALMEENAALRNKVDQQDLRIAEVEGNVKRIETTVATRPAEPVFQPPADSGGWNEPAPRRAARASETIDLGTNLFPAGSDQLTAEGRRSVDAALSRIRSRSGAQITVEGYADATPINKSASRWSSNEQLSQARAESVRKYLISKGIPSSRVDAIGYGAVTRNGKKPSRRVELVIAE
ncbi:MAG: OmpA family protein [Phycisphaeraceae bacterium]|nr:MAG: OmpA family protein [Phycisphaeraceae bacterium]